MNINFPSNPNIGDLYSFAGTTWEWSGEYWGLYLGSTQNPGAIITAFTYSNNIFTIKDASGNTLSVTVNDFTGLTVNGIFSATTISGVTIYGDGSNLTGIPNIYNVDGFLTDNRTLSLSGKSLTIKQGSTGTTETLLNFVDSNNQDLFQIRSEYWFRPIDDIYDPFPGEPTNSIYIGLNAGSGQTNTVVNTVIGSNALISLTGSPTNLQGRSVAIGSNALRSLTTGSFNTAIGDNAAPSLTTGEDNVFIGQNTARIFKSGSFNVFVGHNTMDADLSYSGNRNTVVGGAAGGNASGSTNTFIGERSGRRVFGNDNVMIGHLAGGGIGVGNKFLNGNVFIGNRAGQSETNSGLLYIENSNSVTPLIWGDFTNDLLRFNGKVGVNVQPNTFQFDVNGTSRFSNTVQLDTVNSGLTDTKILTLSSGNVIQYRNFSDFNTGSTTTTGDYLPLSGGTVSGDTIFQIGLTANTISTTQIGSSGDCVNDIYVSNIHSCSPLNINPLGEGDIIFGSNAIFQSAITANTIFALTYLNLPVDNFTGGTVTGTTIFTNGLLSNTISATTISGETIYGDGSNLTNVNNLYNSNGILRSDRIVDLSSYTLNFSSTTNPNTLVLSGGNVYVGTSQISGYKLDINGNTRISASGDSLNFTTSGSRIFFANRELTIGEGATSSYEGIAIGYVSSAQTSGIAIGKWSKAPSGSIVIGNSENDIGDIKSNTIRIGSNNLSGIGIGGGTTSGLISSNEISIGTSSQAIGAGVEGSIAIGRNAVANGNFAIALGSFSTAETGEFVAGAAAGLPYKVISDVYFGSGKRPGVDINGFSYTINGSGAQGTNFNGGNITIAGGKGTGSGNPGVITFATSTSLGSGTTLQSLTERARFSPLGNLLIGTVSDSGNRLVVSSTVDPVRFENLSTVSSDTFLITANSSGVLRELGGNVANRIPYFNSSSAITTSTEFSFNGTDMVLPVGLGGVTFGNGRARIFTPGAPSGLIFETATFQTGVPDTSKSFIFRNKTNNNQLVLDHENTTLPRTRVWGQLEVTNTGSQMQKSFWGRSGILTRVLSASVADTTTNGGSVTDLVANSFATPTFSATTGGNYTSLTNVYIDGAPTVSSNMSGQTLALKVNSGGVLFGGLSLTTEDTRIVTSTSAGLIRYRNYSDFVTVNSSGNTLIGTTTDDSSAILNVSSTTKGFLPPRMTGAQAELIGSPAEGLMVYATDGSGVTITTKGWWGYDGSTWVKLN